MLTNPKLEIFCQHFVANGNAASAARAIGYSNHPAQRGSDLLRRPDIQARVLPSHRASADEIRRDLMAASR
jgi:phage terminase small subunit